MTQLFTKPSAPHLEAKNRAPQSSNAPVFVLGCPRSGTTVLYHMLLSAGGFAIYRAESNVLNLLAPRFGDLRSPRNRRQLLDCWLESKMFRVSGLDRITVERRVLEECRTGGDFLRITMEEVARSQGVERWADCTPEHLLHIPEIHAQLPGSYVIHIIRDGRDVALSYAKQRWAHPLPWDRREHLAVAGLYWEWIVRQGRKYGARLGANYREVRFEELVARPGETLSALGEFIGQELDYERIQRAAIGSVSLPNSSFLDDSSAANFQPVGRWRSKLSDAELRSFEALVGDFLGELGYPLSAPAAAGSWRTFRLRNTYLPFFAIKQWLKTKTRLGRLTHTGRLEISALPAASEREKKPSRG
ncbi:MAG: sulfotransferase [Acidobacteria bacterium]|nr:sulfotransferase [Acidobacteriota bacterium]